MNYPNIIKKLRTKLLLTQSEFASLLGVSFESVNRWENDKNEPSMKMKRQIVKLAKQNKIEMEAFTNDR